MDVLTRHNVTVTGPESGGTGHVLLLAHGFGCDQHMWRLIGPTLAADTTVVTFDHAGAGGADPAAWSPQRHATLDGYAEDVLALCEALDLRRVVFVGHSVAAMIGVLAANRAANRANRSAGRAADPAAERAAERAADRPADRFAALVLVTPSPRYLDDDGYRGGFSREDIDELLDSLDSNYLGWSAAMAPAIMGNPDRPELGAELTNSFCRTDPAIASSFARATFLADNRADLADVTLPTLILQCREDLIAPPEVGAFVHERIAGSRLVTLDATGHCPQLSAPTETAAAIRSFVSNLP